MTSLVINVETLINNNDQYSRDISVLKNLNIRSQNLNSLNITTKDQYNPTTDKFNAKINFLLKQNADFFLLQDLRLSNYNKDILKRHLSCSNLGSYSVILNSSKNSRGVGILINNKIDYKIRRIFSSNCENFLGLDIIVNNFRFFLVSVYGPTEAQHKDFFKQIRTKIMDLGFEFYIIGGDLNSIPSITPSSLHQSLGNLDTYCMRSLPNYQNCLELYNWTTDNFAVDIFRLLNPDLIEFSYKPFGSQRENMSRIDSFLISPNLINIIDKCEYIPSKIKLLDHKTVALFTKKNIKPFDKQIDFKCLNLEGLFEAVKFNIFETILDYFDVPNKVFLTECLARISVLHMEKVNLLNSDFNQDALVLDWINIKEVSISNLCSNFPSIEECYLYPSTTSPEIFLDILLMSIKNSIISFQSNYKKKLNSFKSETKKRLYYLKNLQNWNDSVTSEINDLELKLSVIEDEECIRLIQDSKLFNIVNFEKGSKHFSKVYKNSTRKNCLALLKDNNGQSFKDVQSRDKFLVDQFKMKFEKPHSKNSDIHTFLGNISNHPLVLQHKLTDIERDSLEGDITNEELDLALQTSNFSSSNGPDGIHIKCIHKFWTFLRTPMKIAFNRMILKKELNPLMRCSRISLIAKNGDVDLTKIKSLRPIANLTHLYKIFSGVFVNRLKKYIDKCCYKAQKGYSSKYCIQEGLIYTFETINKAIKTNTPLAVLNLDFSSAFDTIGHEYILEAFKFHNFGPNFLRFLSTCLNNRYGHLATDLGITENFFFNVGTLQGDRPSPDIFKISLNPLILKLVLSENISLPRQITFKSEEAKSHADPLVAFADDMDLFFHPTNESLVACNSILMNFGNMSGLKINRTKTKICLIGDFVNNDFLVSCNNLGFEIVESFKMLGIVFDCKLERMHLNWQRCLEKMVKIRNFWCIFGLSIPGKINILKCYFYPQITYLGSVLNIPADSLLEIEELFINFINQGTPIAKSKIFNPVCKGGLGLIRPRVFLKSLDLLLFKKSLNITDSWSLELRYSALNLNDKFYFPNNIDYNLSPILHRIISSYNEFAVSFWMDHPNSLDLRIFDNPYFTDALNNKFTRALFTNHTWERFGDKFSSLRIKDIVNEEFKCLDRETFQIKNNLVVNVMEFYRISSIFRHSINKLKSKIAEPHLSLDAFFKKKNLKSKNFRKYLTSDTINISTLQTTKNRYSWTQTAGIDVDREIKWLNTWNHSFLPIQIRDFGLKHLNNTIKYNVHKSKINSLVSPSCTFCELERILPAQRETIKHFFIECPTTFSFANNYFNNNLRVLNFIFSQENLLIGAPSYLPDFVIFILNIEILMLNFFLYNCAKKKKTPLMCNFICFIANYRKLFLQNGTYSKKFSKIIFDPG